MPLTETQKKSIKAQLARLKRKNKQAEVGATKADIAKYYKEIMRIVAPIIEKVSRAAMQSYKPEAKKQLSDAMQNPDDFERADQKLKQMMAAFKLELLAASKKMSKEVFAALEKKQKIQFVKEVNKAFGVDLASIVSDKGIKEAVLARVAENSELITSIPKQYISRVRQALLRGYEVGRPPVDMRKIIMEIGGITERKAQLIARDQTQKFVSELNQIRQESVGVKSYIWRTSHDERVRRSHEDNDGKEFRWDDPPAATGHPGEDVNCRCIAEPNLSELKKLL